MVNALKKLDKKFLILVGLILGLPIFIIILLAILQGCGNSKITYEKYEEKMILALQNYSKDMNSEPKLEGEMLSVDLSTLVEKGYIKSTEKLLDDASCEGEVSVRRNGASVSSNDGGYLNYIANLKCSSYETTTLLEKVKENLVTEESGLYQVGAKYVFKGNKVNNHLNLAGKNYRIVSVDENGVLKLVKTDRETVSRIWDNKFNTETGKSSGKNIYKDSLMIDYLLDDYTNVKKIGNKAKKYIMAYDVCIGKRNSTDYTIDSNIDCSEVLEDQIVSLLNISDYANASLDSECTNLRAQSCNNYNYLNGVVSSTWTLNAVLDNSYEVLYLSAGLMSLQPANDSNRYNIVIYIDGNQTYIGGDGTNESPYVIE